MNCESGNVLSDESSNVLSGESSNVLSGESVKLKVVGWPLAIDAGNYRIAVIIDCGKTNSGSGAEMTIASTRWERRR